MYSSHGSARFQPVVRCVEKAGVIADTQQRMTLVCLLSLCTQMYCKRLTFGVHDFAETSVRYKVRSARRGKLRCRWAPRRVWPSSPAPSSPHQSSTPRNHTKLRRRSLHCPSVISVGSSFHRCTSCCCTDSSQPLAMSKS